MHLSAEQQAALDAAMSGKSIFLTGGAGGGKSFTLKQIIASLRQKYSGRPGAVIVVAPTGCAAIQVEGTTIHQWAGLKQVDEQSAATIQTWNRKAWTQVHTLIIDEISMVHDWMLNLLDRMGRSSRKQQNHLPFGGIQLILCGDFLQLPPVRGSYCFKSEARKQAILPAHCFELTFPYRQGGDQDFAGTLSQVRLGTADWKLLDTLSNKSDIRDESDGIQPTLLYSNRANVDAENMENLKRLPGQHSIFVAQDGGDPEAFLPSRLSSWTNAPTQLCLKLNAQVVLLKNIDIQRGLVNGARGIVVGFADGLPTVRFACGLTLPVEHAKWTRTKPDNSSAVVLGTRRQIPLDLAWAITIHKSQGMSLDLVEAELSNCFEDGMAYVALSRCRTLQGFTVTGLTTKSVRANKEAIAFHASITNKNEPGEGPRKKQKTDSTEK
jgi:ATP-dependent DNA helicase PIF1